MITPSQYKKYTNKILRHRSAFTLAEVLVTLTIVGVLAALTIPSLMNSIAEQEYNVGVKKAYSSLSQALQTILLNNDGVVNVGAGATDDYSILLRDDFCSAMSCIKKDTTGNIFTTNYKYYKSDSSSIGTGIIPNRPAAILNNGNFIIFRSLAGYANNGVNACGWIMVDINGSKRPNMHGMDYFGFHIVRNNGAYSIIPFGVSGDGTDCAAGGTDGTTSAGCTYQRLMNPDNMP